MSQNENENGSTRNRRPRKQFKYGPEWMGANQARIAFRHSFANNDVLALYFRMYTMQAGAAPELGCFPSTRQLRTWCDNSGSRMEWAMSELVRIGLVRIVEHGKGKRRNTYVVKGWDSWTPEIFAAIKSAPVRPRKSKNPATGEINV